MQFLLFCQHSFLSSANVSVKKYAVTRKIITFLSFFFFIITQNLHLSTGLKEKAPPDLQKGLSHHAYFSHDHLYYSISITTHSQFANVTLPFISASA